MAENKDQRIALLIDGDNAQAKFIEAMLTEAGKHGKVTIRRIYGNWTDNRLNSWKDQINKFSIRPIQKFAFTSGKNSTDTAMIIDAMDILHKQLVTGFCIASSDSDYTGLAQRIKEDGIFVMGIGEATKTTEAFVNACDLFVFTENLIESGEAVQKEKARTEVKKAPSNQLKNERVATPPVESPAASRLPISRITKRPIDIKKVITAFEMVEDDSGYAYLGEMGVALRKLDPGFDTRTYDSPTMAGLFKKLSDYFELNYKDNGSTVYIKLKKPA